MSFTDRFLILFFRNNHTWRADSLQFLQDGCPDFTRLGMAAQSLFGEYFVAVDCDLEGSTGAGGHRPGANEIFNFAFTQNFVRQTDGAWRIVSSRAVFKLYIQ